MRKKTPYSITGSSRVITWRRKARAYARKLYYSLNGVCDLVHIDRAALSITILFFSNKFRDELLRAQFVPCLPLALVLTLISISATGCSQNGNTSRETSSITATLVKTSESRQDASFISQAQSDPHAPYLLDSGDRLRVAVFGQQNLSRVYSVDGGGYISMHLIGALRVRGKTRFQLENHIAEKLQKKYIKDPKVTVEIVNYRPFFILGEVRTAGQFPYVNGMTVQTAVAIAGGYSPRANEQKVQLTRRLGDRSQTHSVPTNFPVRPGDTIYVQERFF